MLPATSDFNATYGGSKSDYYPIEDSSTDRSAAEMNSVLSDTAAMTHTIVRAWIVFDANTLAVTFFDSVWGNAPGLYPTIYNGSTGVYGISFPATCTDLLGNTQTINFRTGIATVQTTDWNLCQVTSVTANYITVWNWNGFGGGGPVVHNPLAGTITVALI